MVQRGHHYAIVDEVDSILIDEARTPLIISGPSEESTDKYYKIDKIIPKLKRARSSREERRESTTGDYIVDEKPRTVTLTERASRTRRSSSASTTSTIRRTWRSCTRSTRR